MKKIHFIAIGGAAMHNLAIALKKKGFEVTGSDDEIFEPSLSRLKQNGLLPGKFGWDTQRINSDIDAIILGMHALPDNPELKKAQALGMKIYSYPEFLFEQTANKKRIVIAGSHGKTTITAMVIHVLTYNSCKFDFMVGSQIEGFDTMVSLQNDSEIAVFEGDEYLSSPIDPRPKFMHYKPDIALISGIAWDHINVFPTFEGYVNQFRNFVNSIEKGGTLIYYKGDKLLTEISEKEGNEIIKQAYKEHAWQQEKNEFYITTEEGASVPVKIFGQHNFQNLDGARRICNEAGITNEKFYKAISSFPGTQKRLQVVWENNDSVGYLDFAHSPSKVKATVEAVRTKYKNRKLITVLELHTFSSLNKDFIPHYKGSLAGSDKAVVYFDSKVIQHKKLESISNLFISDSFMQSNLEVINDPEKLRQFISSVEKENAVFLFMSSGNFSGINLREYI